MSVRNFDFVPFPLNPDTEFITDIKKRKGEYSGHLKLKITTLDYLYLGSGFCKFADNQMFSETLEEYGELIIPGSSLKGAVRQVSRAVSNACIPRNNEVDRLFLDKEQRMSCKISHYKKKIELNACIVCDMYGMKSLGSKVSFSDLVSIKSKTERIHVPAQHSPKIQNEYYLKEYKGKIYHKGYKFYYTNCETTDDKTDIIEVVSKGVSFIGTIQFHALHEEQMALLMYSLGIGKNFGLKLGGYKSAGLGTVRMDALELIVNGGADNAYNWASNYRKGRYDDYPVQFDELEKIMKYDKRWENAEKN